MGSRSVHEAEKTIEGDQARLYFATSFCTSSAI